MAITQSNMYNNYTPGLDDDIGECLKRLTATINPVVVASSCAV